MLTKTVPYGNSHLSNSLVLRSWWDAFTELWGGGQPARAGQGREEETAASAADSLYQPTTAGERWLERKKGENFSCQQLPVRKKGIFHQPAAEWYKKEPRKKTSQVIFDNTLKCWRSGAGGFVHSEPLSGHVNEGGDQHVDQPDRAKSAGEWILHQSKR